MQEEIKLEPQTPTHKIPSIVIIAAVLNFISCGTLFMLAFISGLFLFFGNMFGMVEYVTNQLSQTYPTLNAASGINLIASIFFSVSVVFFLFFLWIGIGLLRGKSSAWYTQIALSIVGLFGFPIGTVINILILFFFFKPPVRNFFKV